MSSHPEDTNNMKQDSSILENIVKKKPTGRPKGVKNSKTEEEKLKVIENRKLQLKVNFQKYKEQNHPHLLELYKKNNFINREKKGYRVSELYHCKKHIKQLMNMEVIY